MNRCAVAGCSFMWAIRVSFWPFSARVQLFLCWLILSWRKPLALCPSSGRNRTNIEDRKSKGFGICNQILAILSEVPLGKHKIEIGLLLRQAMFINGILFNSEAWQSIHEEEIKLLEDIDNYDCYKLTAKHPLHFFIWKQDPCLLDLFLQIVDWLSTTPSFQGQKKS